MNRINRVLLGILGAQVVLAVLLFMRDDTTAIRKLEPVIADFDPSKVERIRVFDDISSEKKAGTDKKAAAPVSDKAAIDVVKQKDQWVLASHFDYPVDAKKVSDLLDKLKAMKTRGPVATGKARQKQLAVADDSYQRKLVVTVGGKETTVYVGAGAGARQTSVRLAGSDEVEGVSGLTSYGVAADPAGWVDTSYFQTEGKDIASLDVVNQSGSFAIERSAAGGWQVQLNGKPLDIPADSELKVSALDGMVKRLSSIHLAEPGDPKHSFDKALATITLRMKAPTPPAAEADPAATSATSATPVTPVTPATPTTPPAASQGEETIIDIAASDAKDRYYLRVRGNPTVVLVNATSLADLTDLTRDKLIVKKGENKPSSPPNEMDAEGLPPGMDLQQLGP